VQDETRHAHSQLKQSICSLNIKQSSLENMINSSIQQNIELVSAKMLTTIENTIQKEYTVLKGQINEMVSNVFHNNLE